MRGRRRAALPALVAALWLAPSAAPAEHLNRIRIDGSVNPASADFLIRSVQESERDGAAALVIELDTPGGLLSSAKDMVQALLNADVPVIVYVSPRGAWAASAGVFITMAAHVAAMSPGTSIGAASPISIGGGSGGRDEDAKRENVEMEKAEKLTAAFIESIATARKRNVEWARKAVREAEAVSAEEALTLGVIDLVADDFAALLEQLEGREIELDDGVLKLSLAGAAVRDIEMSWSTALFDFLANPSVLFVLLVGGALGLYTEFNQPGLILPGVAGALCLLLLGIGLQVVPFSWVGLVVLLLGVGLVGAEVFLSTYGLLFALGLACMLVGGSMLFDVPEIGGIELPFWSLLVPVVAGFGLFAGVVIFLVGRTALRPQTAGVDELVGMIGRASTSLAPDGKVFIRGEYWSATADEQIPAGEAVEVTAVEGLHIRVRRPGAAH